jgi:hypothetical protein
MSANILWPVPTWARVAIVLASVAFFGGSVVAVWLGNVAALLVVIPSAVLAYRALRFAFDR